MIEISNKRLFLCVTLLGVAAITVSDTVAQRRAIPIDEEDTPALRPLPVDQPLQKNPEEDLFSYATMAYEKRYFAIAEQQFKLYLKDYPRGKHTEIAWFRLGESYLELDKGLKAEPCFERVLEVSGRQGSFAGSAAFRLGSLTYNRDEYKSANTYFALAAAQSDRDDIKISALYYRANCLKVLGSKKDSIKYYEEAAELSKTAMSAADLMADKKDELLRYREACLLAVARMEAEMGNQKRSMEFFNQLSVESNRPAVKAEAVFKSGILAAQMGNHEEARKLFLQTLDMPGAEDWKSDAQFNLIEAYYTEGDYQNVVATYTKGVFPMGDELRPKMLLMVGNAYRHREQFATAIDLYLNVERYFADTNEAIEASYRKLLCFFNLKNPNLPEFVDDYVTTLRQRDGSNQYIDMSLLLKAETHFEANAMDLAAEAYDQIRVEKIPENLRATLLYKKGWAQSECEKPAKAIEAFGGFLEKYSDDPRAVNALAKRGISYRAVEDLTAALKDFERIVEKYERSEVHELAYQQIALIRGQQRNYEGMIEAYSNLLANFPETAAAAEANFWIGWGNFELRKFTESIEPLKKSRNIDKKEFFDRASLRIVLAYRSLEDTDNTKKEIDIVREAKAAVQIPQQVYAWLGVQYFQRKEYPNADVYLTLASSPADPVSTQPIVWKTLGDARFHNENWKDAIEAYDFYLTSDQPSSEKAKVLNSKAQSLMKLEQYAEADIAVGEGIKIQPQGRTSAQLCLTWGEISFAQKNYKDAIQRLIRPSYVFDDEEITPYALSLSAQAHEGLKEMAKAAEVRKKLKTKFPNFKG
jgi:tetratricopeptide (TPR) repeat protein